VPREALGIPIRHQFRRVLWLRLLRRLSGRERVGCIQIMGRWIDFERGRKFARAWAKRDTRNGTRECGEGDWKVTGDIDEKIGF